MTKVEFTHTFEETDIKFVANFAYDGIGPYEFWGAKCCDRGNLELEELYPVENQVIPTEINNRLENVIENLFDCTEGEVLIQAAHEALENQNTDQNNYPEPPDQELEDCLD